MTSRIGKAFINGLAALLLIVPVVPAAAQQITAPGLVPGKAYTGIELMNIYMKGQVARPSCVAGAAGGLTVDCTTGQIFTGSGAAVSAPGVVSLTVSANQTSCVYPAFTACNFVYSNTSGTIANTIVPATAWAGGNWVLAMVTTNASAVTSVIDPATFAPHAAPASAGNLVGTAGTYTGIAPVGNSVAAPVYNTAPAASAGSITATTTITPTAAGNFRLTFYVTQTVLGTSCTAASTVQTAAVFTDPNAASAQTQNVALFTTSGAGNGVLGIVPWTSGLQSFVFRAKASTAIQFQTTFTAGTACAPAPTVQVFPVLEAL